jgi:hypothetical protein
MKDEKNKIKISCLIFTKLIFLCKKNKKKKEKEEEEGNSSISNLVVCTYL